jgi:hypothetical protein
VRVGLGGQFTGVLGDQAGGQFRVHDDRSFWWYRVLVT